MRGARVRGLERASDVLSQRVTESRLFSIRQYDAQGTLQDEHRQYQTLPWAERTLTIQLGGRRKKRDSGLPEEDGDCLAADATFQGFYGCHFSNFLKDKKGTFWYHLADVLWHGKTSPLFCRFHVMTGFTCT